MAFNNYTTLIKSHQRDFQIYQKSAGSRVATTSRYQKGDYGNAINARGVFMYITAEDYERYPDFELDSSDMKLISTPEMLNITPALKDRIVYNGVNYWAYKIINRVHYGNFYLIFLKHEEFGV